MAKDNGLNRWSNKPKIQSIVFLTRCFISLYLVNTHLSFSFTLQRKCEKFTSVTYRYRLYCTISCVIPNFLLLGRCRRFNILMFYIVRLMFISFRWRRKCGKLLLNNYLLLFVVVINIIDCALVLGELIFDLHHVKGKIEHNNQLLPNKMEISNNVISASQCRDLEEVDYQNVYAGSSHLRLHHFQR